MATRAAQRRERIFVDGDWLETDETIAVSDLADGGTFAQVGATGPAEARTALEAAHEIKPELRQTTVVERAEWCEAIAEGLREREEELAEVIVREAGKPISSARGEVGQAAERFDRAAEEARNIVSKGEFREGSTAGHEGWNAIVKHEPIGAVLCITPYNYPLATTALQVAPALAAGNSVLLKPASKTPVSAAILADVIADVDGIPDGAFNFVPGNASEIGDVLSGDDRINAIAMTGSSGAGKHVAGESGMVNLHMELGGNAPAVVFDDADLTDVAGNCVKGSLKYAGQRCSAVSRVLAHEPIHDDLVSQIDRTMDSWEAGDLFDETTAFGPLISEDQAEWVQELVDDAVEKGADLVRGGKRRAPEGVPDELADQFFEPTLLANVPHDARIVDEEQFGPVAAITTFEDEDEAIELANGSDLALDAAVFTSDYDRAMRLADLIDAGAVRINGAPSHGLGDVPFGGNKDSGIGREGLDASIHEMMRKKSIIL
ncbi:aldehyde dehydrogenase family protein [Natrialba asiatica]|uniref:Aldehyde dehydrogenase n=1 Tax=Natrialba asiatica (strain ATCC 700177 / DSM 12278 / JCM 9576 / FERM P-10747 / NBRC 102637 / 172P1) TaxID=29540 RepID=M0AUH9_NATA1|nr:aldehyde dehydrogenase family protein [Natrialba asiatica]ELZ01004.1 aldehyde dehydrogenase [Natrialba asiatica DSM 12278]